MNLKTILQEAGYYPHAVPHLGKEYVGVTVDNVGRLFADIIHVLSPKLGDKNADELRQYDIVNLTIQHFPHMKLHVVSEHFAIGKRFVLFWTSEVWERS